MGAGGATLTGTATSMGFIGARMLSMLPLSEAAEGAGAGASWLSPFKAGLSALCEMPSGLGSAGAACLKMNLLAN